ncbi:MAG: A/G-specific adenine glycosylase, partial [Clostridia bacterium]|nr:A/G-specific adenine glycosylase [Clostridia bacterium]
PYHIWVSEIMLQQTRVEAVKGYYARFLAALPTVEALASCGDDALHKLWEGLGYYSRVRNMKKAAIAIVEQHEGCFPRSYAEVLALPGIGEYTAGAICSIAYDLPTPAVDGNVLRVYARLTDDDRPVDAPEVKKEVRAALEAVYPDRAGSFTQALMELGATLCGPDRPPECEKCPCAQICWGAQRGTAASLPRRLPKREKRQEDRTVFILSCDGAFALEKRPSRGLLAGLWQFPNVAGDLSTAQALEQLERWGLMPREVYKEIRRKHIFTHIRWDMKGIYLEVAEPAGPFTWLTARKIRQEAALPTAFRQFWEDESDV